MDDRPRGHTQTHAGTMAVARRGFTVAGPSRDKHRPKITPSLSNNMVNDNTLTDKSNDDNDKSRT